jgi:hypothetical protein
VFWTLWALREDPLLPANELTILAPASRPVHQAHGIWSAFLSFVAGLAVWRWFPGLEKRAQDVTTLRSVKWGTLAVACLMVLVPVAPRRAVWESYPIVSFDRRTALVMGTTGEELLLYAPDEAGRPRFRVPVDSPGLRRTGETRPLFAGVRPSP